MKVLAINGSPRKEGNTSYLINMVLDQLKKEGIDTEFYNSRGKNIKGCIACYKCFENTDKMCGVINDDVNEIIEKMLDADGIILGSPTFFANVSTEIKAIIDRTGLVAKANDDMFRHKVGAAVVAVRRGGGIHVFNSINHFFLINQMHIPGSSYWNLGIGLNPGDVEGDDEGVGTMANLGKNMAWLLKKING